MSAMVEVPCADATCAHLICMPEHTQRRLRETHKTFYCPAGHDNYYPGKTREEKRIETLEEELRQMRREVRYLERANERLARSITCPLEWCPQHGYTYANVSTLLGHLNRAHNMQMQWAEPLAIGAGAS